MSGAFVPGAQEVRMVMLLGRDTAVSMGEGLPRPPSKFSGAEPKPGSASSSLPLGH